MNQGNRVRLLLTILILSLLLGGCGTAMKQLGEGLSDEYIDFNATYVAEFSKRSSNAIAVNKSAESLQNEEFINLGSLAVKYVDKRCFPGEECELESHTGLPSARLLKEAALVGGDAVKITQDNQNGTGQAVKNGACIRTKTQQVPRSQCDYETVCSGTSCYTRKTICHTVYDTQTVCAEWQKIYGTEFYRRSTASVWRNDPQLIVDVKFGDLFYEAIGSGDAAKAGEHLAQGIRADLPDLRGRYPLMTAVEAKQNAASVTRLLLEHKAKPTIDNNKPIEVATKKNDLELARVLLEHGANPNDSVGIWGLLFTSEEKMIEKGGPIINASSNNNIEMVKVLLENKADPNVGDGQPLRNAIHFDNDRMMFLLLEHRASVREDGVLTAAVEKGNVELVKLMFERGASANNRSWSGKTPLQAAAEDGHIDILRLLLDKGASLDKRGVGGANTPLMFAASAGQVEAVRILIDRGANVNVDDIPTGIGWIASMAGLQGKTALSMARSKQTSSSDSTRKADYQKIVDLLIAAGAKENP